MTDDRRLLRESISAVLRHHCGPEVVKAAEGDWAREVWQRLVEMGTTLVGVPEALGGSGGDLVDAAVIVKTAARFAAPVPLAETLLIGGPLHVAFGIQTEPGPVTLAYSSGIDRPMLRRSGLGWVLDGEVRRVAWARRCARVFVVAKSEGGRPMLVVVRPGQFELSYGQNIAGEPRDDLQFSEAELEGHDVFEMSDANARATRRHASLSRLVQSAGALERTLELTSEYATHREQFGRSIGSFQAIKQLLARLAEEVAAGVSASEGALAGVASDRAEFIIAAARVRSARSATIATEIAHQIHGAMGFTREHELGHFTRRLWAWRDEYGTEGEWQQILGRMVLECGSDAVWPLIVGV